MLFWVLERGEGRDDAITYTTWKAILAVMMVYEVENDA